MFLVHRITYLCKDNVMFPNSNSIIFLLFSAIFQSFIKIEEVFTYNCIFLHFPFIYVLGPQILSIMLEPRIELIFPMTFFDQTFLNLV